MKLTVGAKGKAL